MNDNFFNSLSVDKQDEIKQKYAAAYLNNDIDVISVYKSFYGIENLEFNNPYLKFVV